MYRDTISTREPAHYKGRPPALLFMPGLGIKGKSNNVVLIRNVRSHLPYLISGRTTLYCMLVIWMCARSSDCLWTKYWRRRRRPRAARIWRGQGIAPGTGASSRFPVSRRRRDSRKTAMQARLPKPWRRSCNAPVIPSTAHVVASFARRNRPQRSSAVQWPTVAAG